MPGFTVSHWPKHAQFGPLLIKQVLLDILSFQTYCVFFSFCPKIWDTFLPKVYLIWHIVHFVALTLSNPLFFIWSENMIYISSKSICNFIFFALCCSYSSEHNSVLYLVRNDVLHFFQKYISFHICAKIRYIFFIIMREIWTK